MRIFIDVSVLTLATFVTGIQRVTREIAVRLIEDEAFDVCLLHYNAAKDAFYRIDNRAFCAYYLEHKGVKEKMITRRQVKVEEIGRGTVFFDLDAAWMCRVKRSYLLPIIKRQGAKIIAHIYDIISVTHPQFCLERGVYNFMDFIGAHLQYADRIIVNAKATVDELKKLCRRLGCRLPECSVVPLGADFGENRVIEDREVPGELVRLANDRPYILMVGTIEPRKNHRLLLDAYERGLRDMGYGIVFAGYMGWKMEEFEQRLKNHEDFGKGVYHFQGLGDPEIAYLYQHARFLVFCSYTEGYGLPLIEAIMRGTPVIASDIPVSREVAGDYCVYFEQDNVEEVCRIIAYFEKHDTEYEDMKRALCSFAPCGWMQSGERMKAQIVACQEENR